MLIQFLGHRLGVWLSGRVLLSMENLGFNPQHCKNQNPEGFFRYKLNTFWVISPSKMIKT